MEIPNGDVTTTAATVNVSLAIPMVLVPTSYPTIIDCIDMRAKVIFFVIMLIIILMFLPNIFLCGQFTMIFCIFRLGVRSRKKRMRGLRN